MLRSGDSKVWKGQLYSQENGPLTPVLFVLDNVEELPLMYPTLSHLMIGMFQEADMHESSFRYLCRVAA